MNILQDSDWRRAGKIGHFYFAPPWSLVSRMGTRSNLATLPRTLCRRKLTQTHPGTQFSHVRLRRRNVGDSHANRLALYPVACLLCASQELVSERTVSSMLARRERSPQAPEPLGGTDESVPRRPAWACILWAKRSCQSRPCSFRSVRAGSSRRMRRAEAARAIRSSGRTPP